MSTLFYRKITWPFSFSIFLHIKISRKYFSRWTLRRRPWNYQQIGAETHMLSCDLLDGQLFAKIIDFLTHVEIRWGKELSFAKVTGDSRWLRRLKHLLLSMPCWWRCNNDMHPYILINWLHFTCTLAVNWHLGQLCIIWASLSAIIKGVFAFLVHEWGIYISKSHCSVDAGVIWCLLCYRYVLQNAWCRQVGPW